ncbi:MAG: hypothetical protein AB7O24_25720 [Kofleriaceae bacterium]
MASVPGALSGAPERIFVSVDESTGKSTVSFSPPDIGTPFQHENDRDGAMALRDAQTIIARYPKATIHGPHFHAARQPRVRPRRGP